MEEFDVVEISCATYMELFPRMSQLQKKMLPIFVLLNGEYLHLDREEFEKTLRFPHISYIFSRDVLPKD